MAALRGWPIRIAVVHSFYEGRSPSGENVVVGNQVRALKRAGHDVRLFSIRTDGARNESFYRTRAALRVASGTGRRPIGLREFDPDVIHIHNLFPNFGRRWAGREHAPIIATLHNYRPICANAHLLREGRICTRCPDGAPWSGFRYACYRGSRLATAPLTVATWSATERDPLLCHADRLLVMSETMARVYERAGVARDRMSVMPNFLPDELVPRVSQTTSPMRWLYVGRLSPEKGILDLVRRWPDSHQLTIVGDGPQREAVEAASRGKPVDLAGSVSHKGVLSLMQTGIGLVFPSRWLEGSPLVYLEALASGLPVLAWHPNVLAQTVESEGTGHSVSWDRDLKEQLNRAQGTFAEMRSRCRHVFNQNYSEGAFVSRTERVYDQVLGNAER